MNLARIIVAALAALGAFFRANRPTMTPPPAVVPGPMRRTRMHARRRVPRRYHIRLLSRPSW